MLRVRRLALAVSGPRSCMEGCRVSGIHSVISLRLTYRRQQIVFTQLDNEGSCKYSTLHAPDDTRSCRSFCPDNYVRFRLTISILRRCTHLACAGCLGWLHCQPRAYPEPYREERHRQHHCAFRRQPRELGVRYCLYVLSRRMPPMLTLAFPYRS